MLYKSNIKLNSILFPKACLNVHLSVKHSVNMLDKMLKKWAANIKTRPMCVKGCVNNMRTRILFLSFFSEKFPGKSKKKIEEKKMRKNASRIWNLKRRRKWTQYPDIVLLCHLCWTTYRIFFLLLQFTLVGISVKFQLNRKFQFKCLQNYF